MPHLHTFDAIILKTYDVGEADRFCIVFTRERGRLVARASGARKIHSRLGAALLPFRHILLQMKEGSAGWIVTGAHPVGKEMPIVPLAVFTALEEGIEILLRLVSHEGALPDIFDATIAFLNACRRQEPAAALAYSFSLLHALGLLPGELELGEMFALGAEDRNFIRSASAGTSVSGPCDRSLLEAVRGHFLGLHLNAPLKAGTIAGAMASAD